MAVIIPAPLAQKIASIAASFTAIQYDQYDPHKELIEECARQHGLELCPSTSITPRTIRGCTPPPPVSTLELQVSVLAAALEATPGIVVVDEDWPARATELLKELSRQNWALYRQDGAPGTPK